MEGHVCGLISVMRTCCVMHMRTREPYHENMSHPTTHDHIDPYKVTSSSWCNNTFMQTCSFSAFPGTCNFSPQTAIIPKIFPISFKCTEHRNDPLTQRHYPRSSHTSIHPSNVITCNITWIWKKITFVCVHANDFPQSSLSLSSYLSSFFFAPFPIQPTIIICNNIVDLPEVKGSHRKFRTIVSSLIGTCNMVYGVCSLIKKVYKLIQLWGPPSLKRWPRASLEGLLLWWWWWKVAARVRPSLPVSAWIRFRLSLGHLLSLFF